MLTLKKTKPVSLNLYDDDTVKWENEGKSYCLHIQQDEMPLDPRADMDNVTVMACWHRQYLSLIHIFVLIPVDLEGHQAKEKRRGDCLCAFSLCLDTVGYSVHY